jgi:hypothetical protein
MGPQDTAGKRHQCPAEPGLAVRHAARASPPSGRRWDDFSQPRREPRWDGGELHAESSHHRVASCGRE